MSETVLSARGIVKRFAVRRNLFARTREFVHAVDDISLDVDAGDTLGIVGESGCGKSTLGRALLWLDVPEHGEVAIAGTRLRDLNRHALRAMRKQMQIVFQDPFESLNSRHTIAGILTEPYAIHGMGNANERDRWVCELLERVGLPANARQRFPHEFSGGQRQRIGIARAIALRPKLLICDEAVSALDVSVQAQIVNLLLELQRDMGLAMVFIAHDLTVVKHVSDRVAVMYLGQIVETASATRIYSAPRHPYTRALISAIPAHGLSTGDAHSAPAHSTRIRLTGDVPSPIHLPAGCRFHTRCAHATEQCRTERPELETLSDGSSVRCHRWRDL